MVADMSLTVSNLTILYLAAIAIGIVSIICIRKSNEENNFEVLGLLLGLMAIALGIGAMILHNNKSYEESLKTLPAEWLSLCTELQAAGTDSTLKRSIWDSFRKMNPPKIKPEQYRIVVYRNSIKWLVNDTIMEFVELPFSQTIKE